MTGRALQALFFCLGLGIITCESAWPQVSVWTHRYDNARSGANLAETQLNTSTVNSSQFGRLFSYPVDADIYTQPLVISSVNIAGKGMHDVVYVATNNNSVYAFDADSNLGSNAQPLWQVNFNGPGVTPIPASDVSTENSIRTPGPIGIMGTPVIDQTTGTMYLVARTKETSGSNVNYVQRLHALDITSGAEKFGGPVVIQATVAGTGYDNVGGIVTFNPLQENQRAGLALANGNVYIAWASYGDGDPYHGWIMAYSAATLQQTGVFCVTPGGQRGGIWQSGQPLSIDASGNLYVATGNGTFDGVHNFGESMLKLNSNLSSVVDWFTPDNWSNLNTADLDFGSGGLLLVPGSNDVVASDKEGRFYVTQQNNLGHTQAGNGQILQIIQVTSGEHIHGAPAYWNGPTGPWVYVWGEEDYLRAFAFNGSTFNTPAISQSTYPAPPGMPGGFLTISANGSQTGSGILWASIPYAEDANEDIVSGVLRAFDARDLTHELWNTRMVPARDDLGNFAKYVPPTVANGRVYVASFSNRLHVYGLLASILPGTGGSIVGSGVTSTSAVNLTATGTSDWAQWPGYDDKNTGKEQISDITFVGPASSNFSVYSDDPRTLSWNDGTPMLCNSSAEGASVIGTGNGFLITVPADTTTRTLNLYVGGSNSRGMLSAHLSDGSAPDFVDTGLSSTGQYDGVYTLNYHAASADEQLTVLWTQFSGAGNITLQGAGLIGSSDPPPPTACIWVDDAVPPWATLVSDGGDSWDWVSSNPAPYSGALAHQSAIAGGEHQHYFDNAATMLPVAAGDTLFTYVYLDPANPPSEVMLQWRDSSWNHRAYWGPNLLTAWGTDGTPSLQNIGPLPPTGQWVQLAVPAAQVGLAGSTVNGMSYTLYGGRATWDYSGKTSGTAPTFQVSGTVTLSGAGLSGVNFAATGGASCTVSGAAGGYTCTVPQGWSGTVTPSLSGYAFTPISISYSGVAANQTAQNYTATLLTYQVSGTVTLSGAGLSGVNFAATGGASCTVSGAAGGYTCTVPQGWSGTVTPSLSGYAFTPISISYSGVAANQTAQNYTATLAVTYQVSGTVMLSGAGLSGVNFAATGGASCTVAGATGSYTCTVPQGWSGTVTPSLSGYTFTPTSISYSNVTANQTAQNYTAAVSTTVVWVDDAVPAGATLGSDGGDTWDWISSNPMPYSGALAHQSAIASGEHQHYFYNATATLSVAAGDTLFAYVYLDPANPPSEVMLQWNNGTWNQRAYWGSDLISWGTDGTVSRVYMGPLPAVGQWVQLAVPAAQVGLVGSTLNGMAYSLYGGRATWDYAGMTTGAAFQVSGAVTLSGAGLSGVNFAATGGASCTVSGATGSYTCTVPQGWSGTVTPSLSGYTFTPTSISYSGVAANQTAQNYTATLLTYQVSGTVTLSGAGLSGVNFAATGGASCTVSGAAGGYTCTVPQGWSGTVTPSSTGYTFTPTSISYSGVAANQTAQNYTATLLTYQVSGNVTLSGAGLSGVNFAATGGASCTVSGAAGGYTCTVPQGWSGTVTPSLSGYTFTPTSISYSGVAANQTAQNYTATLLTYQVSGTVTLSGAGLSGVNFAATGGASCTVSGAAGGYTCTVPQGWSGTVTPSLSGYAFTPISISYSGVAANQTAQNYTATLAVTYQVSGTVMLSGAGLSGVNFAATGGASCTVAGATGSYTCTVPQGWSGTVTPSLSGYTFTPTSISYSNVTANQTAQNYTAAVSTTVVWVDDAVPAGATLGSDGGDTWDWISSNPMPYSGALAHQSAIASGEHQHYFYNATATLSVAAGDTLFAYVYLDPANPPSEVMLQWNNGTWNQRAYWGSDLISWGTDGTVSRVYMGPLPAVGQWVQLAVPAAQVGLVGSTLNGMAYSLYGGRATWDYAGMTTGAAFQVSGAVTLSGAGLSGVNFAATGGASCTVSGATGSYTCTVPQGWSGTVTPSLSGYTFTPTSISYSGVAANQTAQNYTAAVSTSVVWVDDAVPAGATLGSDGGDTWDWISSNPTPYSGALAHQSAIASGEHQHYFYNATATLSVAAGDTLFAYVYLDPANPPSEVMLQWNNGTWNHRAYWGSDLISWGTDGTVSRVYMGPLPAAGQWARLAVPAAQVGLEGSTLNGMAYSLYGGRATWDYAGE